MIFFPVLFVSGSIILIYEDGGCDIPPPLVLVLLVVMELKVKVC